MNKPMPTQEEVRRVNAEFAGVSVVALIIIAIGVGFYMSVERLSVVDAVYFSIITLTTVGYGDITPQTEVGKLFTAGYVLVGIGIIGAFAGLIFKRSAMNRQFRQSKRKK